MSGPIVPCATVMRWRSYRPSREADLRFVTNQPIEPATLLDEVCGPGRGGTAMFLGTVRMGPDDGPVVSIDYSGYEEMVEAEFGRIVAEAEERWPDGRVTGRHRLGTITVGDASVAVAAAAPHRAQAFDMCRHAIEEVKKRLPVWKKEQFADGATAWRENG